MKHMMGRKKFAKIKSGGAQNAQARDLLQGKFAHGGWDAHMMSPKKGSRQAIKHPTMMQALLETRRTITFLKHHTGACNRMSAGHAEHQYSDLLHARLVP